MGLYKRLVATLYDRSMRRAERLCLQRWRAELLRPLNGDVLEIGAGTGANLPYYPRLNRLELCEPEAAMRDKLTLRLETDRGVECVVNSCPAERLSFSDNSFDFVVSSLVLCSVSDPHQAIAEIKRVLRPGGSLVLLEHVAADAGTWLRFLQRLLRPLWRLFACNCHLDRTTSRHLAAAGFRLDLNEERLLGVPVIVTPLIVGRAYRP